MPARSVSRFPEKGKREWRQTILPAVARRKKRKRVLVGHEHYFGARKEREPGLPSFSKEREGGGKASLIRTLIEKKKLKISFYNQRKKRAPR